LQQLLEQQAQHEEMVNFTVQDAFNKAKAGVKLPLLQPPIKAQSVSPGRKLAQNEYYKHIKEKA
jgi:hypothetical protein